MEIEAFAYLYLMAIGFVVAGATMSAFHLVTGHPLGFALGQLGGSPLAIASIVLRLVAGPAILVRNAVQSGMSLRADPFWLVIGLVFASAWALASGALVLQSFGPVLAGR